MNYNRANNFHPVADKFAMCTGQGVTFEPTSNAHARVDYNTLTVVSVVLHRPDNNKTKSSCLLPNRHGHYRSHCNHGNVHSHLCNMQVCHHV